MMMMMMIKVCIVGAVQVCEVFLSTLAHLFYGLYIFGYVVVGDLLMPLNGLYNYKPNQKKKLFGMKEEDVASPTQCSELFKVHDHASTTTTHHDLPPIILLHGVFGFGQGRMGGLSYFAGAEKKVEKVFVPDLGSLTSIYDRARELFYYLKGGKVDYGQEHSKACGHSQFGRLYKQGHYPEWDEDHPVHFVGHSAGAQVSRVLQQMLAEKAFKGYDNTSDTWVLSITSLSGAFNGTTRAYLDGIQTEDGRSLKAASMLHLCSVIVILYDWLDISWLKVYYNFGFDHFNMSRKKSGIRGLMKCLLGHSGPFASADWLLPDVTIQGSVRLNARLPTTFPNTYYFSYATKRTMKFRGIWTLPSSILGIHPVLFIRVLQMSQWRHSAHATPPYQGFKDEDWWDNDGAINTISMTHPRLPFEHPSQQLVNDSDCHPLQPGIWYYKFVEGDHIMFIMNRNRAGVQFDLIYDSIFERCRNHVLRKKNVSTLLPHPHHMY